jgi:cold shock CspA family protein
MVAAMRPDGRVLMTRRTDNGTWCLPVASFRLVAPASLAREDHSVRNEALDIRRPKLQGVRRFGTVRWFKEEKGYGRITADDGEVLFVHFSAIELDGYRALIAGQRVSFVWNGGIVDFGRHTADSVQPQPSCPNGRRRA